MQPVFHAPPCVHTNPAGPNRIAATRRGCRSGGRCRLSSGIRPDPDIFGAGRERIDDLAQRSRDSTPESVLTKFGANPAAILQGPLVCRRPRQGPGNNEGRREAAGVGIVARRGSWRKCSAAPEAAETARPPRRAGAATADPSPATSATAVRSSTPWCSRPSTLPVSALRLCATPCGRR